MLHIGSRVDTCRDCGRRRAVGVFYVLRPPHQVHLCAECLRQLAKAVDQAAAALALLTGRRTA